MLNRDDIVRIIKDMSLPKDEYWITSGAGLVLHGVKEVTADIDLGCTTKLIEKYIKMGCKYRTYNNNLRILEVNDKIEMLENWVVDKVELINELAVASLDSIKKQKMELGREKDIRDIILIDEYIKNIG